MSDSSRLDSLELAVARLTKELVALRSEVRSEVRADARAERPREARASSQVDEAFAPTPPRTGLTDATTRVDAADGNTPSDLAAATTSAEPDVRAAESGRGAPFISDELRRLASATTSSNRASGRAWSAPPGVARPPAPSPFRRQNLEALIGRYGTLALAAFTILMGVGVFIGWAIKNGVIGPELRVALGALLAAVVGTIGWRVRRGDSPRFGSVLLALALAIVHVVCWGAGPLLQLVPNVLALGVGASASAALALLALRDEDQSLFNVGFGGALLAPFVTSSETGDAVILLLYGAIVLGAGMRAMRDRAWSKTPFVLGLGVLAYTAAASGQLSESDAWARAGAPGIFAVAAAWLSLILVRGKPRERLAVTGLLAAVGTLGAMHHRDSVDGIRYALAALATVSGFLVGTGGTSERIVRLATSLVIPFSALLAALITLSDVSSPTGVAIALLWAIGSVIAAVANRDGGRQWHAFAAAAVGGFAVVLHFDGGVNSAMALAAYGAVASIVMRRFELRGAGVAILLWLAAGAVVAFAKLDARAQWLNNPFLTPASAAAAAICAAWLIFSWNASRLGTTGQVVTTLPRTVVRILGALLTFLWIHVELSHAVSIDVSTFLLVAYYAVTGILAIGIGRWRSIPLLRQLGLALSVFAAIKAMVETSSLSIGWRVGGYLLAGAFLLGVAYWYRGTGGGRDATESIAA